MISEQTTIIIFMLVFAVTVLLLSRMEIVMKVTKIVAIIMLGASVLYLTAIAVCMPEPCIFISLYLLFCYGQWSDDNKHGQGVLKYVDGSLYEGEWRNGKRHKKGKFIDVDTR